MRISNPTGAVALAAALLLLSAEALAFDDAKYPDFAGQWFRIGHAQWDPAKPIGFAQEPPLKPAYRESYVASVANQNAGGQGNNMTPHCIPPGMPRAMIGYEPM